MCKICDRCDSYLYRPIEPTPHSFGQWVTIRPSTFSREGEKTRSCNECGFQKLRTVQMRSHGFLDVKKDAYYFGAVC